MINKNTYIPSELAKDIHQNNDIVMILKVEDIFCFCEHKGKKIPKYYRVMNFNQKRMYFIHFNYLKELNED